MAISCKTGRHVMTCYSSTTQSSGAHSVLQGGNVNIHLTSAGYQRLVVTLNLPPAQSWMTSHTVNIDPPLSISVCEYLSSEASNDEDGILGRQTGSATPMQQSDQSHFLWRVRHMPCDASQATADPSAPCKACKPPSNRVIGQASTRCDIV
jgi:hypothetical protein